MIDPKVKKTELANGFALATGVLWVLCSAFVAIFPSFSQTVTEWWLHGMNLDVVGGFQLDLANFLWGGLTLIASFWVVGYVLGWSLKMVNKGR
jgi:hypothetical protein